MKKLLLSLLACLTLHTAAFAVVHTVQVSEFQFSPAVVNASINDTIRWQWVNGSHTTTSAAVPSGASPWNSPISQTSPTFQYVLSTPGTYQYICSPHPAMQGSILVTGNTIGEIALPELKMYPIPAKKELFFENFSPTDLVYITDLQGKLLYSGNLMRKDNIYSADISRLTPGIYLIQIVGDSRKQSLKFIKE